MPVICYYRGAFKPLGIMSLEVLWARLFILFVTSPEVLESYA